ncbi:single-stranded-DNA-specific exonuclease RecJ [Desulfobacter latus]|uniref:Single-stranded-DNA-specific exonuclease RecJ n=1 Tax=Desulfobacter latus TaxID=2292 RepID=A0A850T521_9BACT|nr:DHH family phosphoesterase [Desulfobacter latus]NWH06873.1 single-stranded-DNA-specific exonuclease RecJ [Desulfobacter latus]
MRLTGHRVKDGYGLTESVSEKIFGLNPNLVITADAGISDEQMIEKLSDAGIDVIVTDHHLIPVEGIPKAAVAVIDPQQEICSYDSKIAGCGVAWLLMTAVAQKLCATQEQKQVLHQMLDYVALGTVADLVSLDSVTNRYFVKKGLEFMNQKRRPCWQIALNEKIAGVGDLGFQIGPRVNASSRMTGRADTAIDFLISEDPDQVTCSYEFLDQQNRKRQSIENKILTEAQKSVTRKESVIVYYSAENHAGIQGIVAGKLAEEYGIPCIMLADVGNDIVAGSGRAGQFLHLKDALATFNEKHPGILMSYGGHKAAAGLKLHKNHVEIFQHKFCELVRQQLKGQDITPYKSTDGALNGFINLETYFQIEKLKPFGMGFPTPLFYDEMIATRIRVIGRTRNHLSMMLDNHKAVFFNALETPDSPWPVNEGESICALYTLNLNEWMGQKNLQLIIREITKPEQ